jgi:hypothetical protein
MNSPPAPDTAVRDWPVLVLVTVTVAPGTTESLESFTDPEIAPVKVCASAGALNTRSDATVTTARREHRVQESQRIITNLYCMQHGADIGRSILGALAVR